MSNKRSLLREMAETTVTDYWNDSCIEQELRYAIEHGAVGATTNPVIVLSALKKELPQWEERIREIVRAHPHDDEDTVTWAVIECIATERAQFFAPVYEREQKKKGRLSIQTSPKFHNNSELLTEQALYLNTLYPNNNIKIPATAAGIEAIEKVSAEGVSVNATVSFTVSQAIAVAEAIERGMKRREEAGHDTAQMASVCTIMVGRVDDWMKTIVARDNLTVNPEWLEWAGVAVIKNAYRIYQKRGYRTRLLAAAFRNHYHWSELIGGDLVISMPYSWAQRFNASSIRIESRIDTPVNPQYLEGLRRHIPDFSRSYDADGMTIEEFDEYGGTRRTLRQFLSGYSDLVTLVRNYIVTNPDL